jgi:hypothetical protein
MAALLLAATAVHSAEPPLGRLFHTPTERATLDDARRRNIRAEALAAEPAKRPRIPPARIVTLTGVVQRSDGEAYAWVNGKPVEMARGQQRRMRVTPGQPAVRMRSADRGDAVEIKVGQRADLRTGRVQEAYELKRSTAQVEATGPAATAEAPSQASVRTQRGADSQPRSSARDAENAQEDEDVER